MMTVNDGRTSNQRDRIDGTDDDDRAFLIS